MSRSPSYRLGDAEWDGKPPIFIHTGRLVNAASVVYGGGFVAPCNGLIVALPYKITTAFTHASSKLSFGKASDLDSHLDDFVTYNIGAVGGDLIGDVLLVDRAIVKGEAYTFSMAAADTTGVLFASVAIMPT